MSSPKRKVTLYFNAGMLSETQKEAIRQDRSVSWIIQAAWKIAREEVRRLPGVGGVTGAGGGNGMGALGSGGSSTAAPSTPGVPSVEPVRTAAPLSDGQSRRPARE
jgi:uncharacterized small protein (TIGR04563 family)